jgi:hypothetical protein
MGNRSLPKLAGPNLPNSLQFSLDAATGQTKSRADFLIRETIELVLGDLAEAIVVEQVHQALKLFGGNHFDFWRGIVAKQLVETRIAAIMVATLQHGVAANPSAAAFLLGEVALVVDHLTDGNGGQKLPELLAIDQRGELAARGAVAETPHHAQCDVFLVAHPPGRRCELLASQLDQLLVVPLPQRVSGLLTAGFELPDPVRNCSVVGHNRPRPKIEIELTCLAHATVGPALVGPKTVPTI